jgi:hypothetical protein
MAATTGKATREELSSGFLIRQYKEEKEFQKDVQVLTPQGWRVQQVIHQEQRAGAARIATIGLGAMVWKPKAKLLAVYELDRAAYMKTFPTTGKGSFEYVDGHPQFQRISGSYKDEVRVTGQSLEFGRNEREGFEMAFSIPLTEIRDARQSDIGWAKKRCLEVDTRIDGAASTLRFKARGLKGEKDTFELVGTIIMQLAPQPVPRVNTRGRL